MAIRSKMGSTGRQATFKLSPRPESWATTLARKKKPKLHVARISSYMLDYDEMLEWLIRRFEAISATDIKLKEEEDWFIFNIPEDERITDDDKAAIERMRSAS